MFFNQTSMECKCCSLSGEITLYRLTSHPVVDLSTPGEFYVCDESAIDPDLLEKNSGELFLITVKCDASNINMEQSEKECVILDNPNIIAVNNDSECEIISVVPYNKNQPLKEGIFNESVIEEIGTSWLDKSAGAPTKDEINILNELISALTSIKDRADNGDITNADRNWLEELKYAITLHQQE